MKALWGSVALALLSAKQIEPGQSQPSAYRALLDQLVKTMKHHHVRLRKPNGTYLEKRFKSYQGGLQRSDKGRDSKLKARMHWSNFNPKFSHELKWEDSFLSLATHSGLCNYLDEYLGQSRNVLKPKKGRPLLNYPMALHHWFGTTSLPQPWSKFSFAMAQN